jgi:CBS domain containing-hemolysin-like protein
MSVLWLGVISASAFLFAAFFAGSETAIIASDRIRLRHLAEKGDRRAILLMRYIDNPEYFLSIVLVGTNIGMIGCTTTFTAIMIRYFGDSGATIATVVLVPSLMVFQEILPKGIFLYYADRASLISIVPLKVFAAALYPVIKSFAELSNFLARIAGVYKVDERVRMTKEELLFHLESSKRAGAIGPGTMTLVSRALEMVAFAAKDVMLDLDRVVMVEDGLSVDEYKRTFAKERFSRFPVYRGNRQHVVGFLSIHGLLLARQPLQERPVVEPPYFVQTETPVAEMMVQMKNQGCHMAMVRDRTGRLVGMTTLEDILERLVGAITDEFH